MSEAGDDDVFSDQELSTFQDGELAPARADALRAQLERSPALAARLAALRRVDDALRALPAPPVPRDLLARVKNARPPEAAAQRGAAERSSTAPADPATHLQAGAEGLEAARAKLRVDEARASMRRARRRARRSLRGSRRGLWLGGGVAAAAALAALALWLAPRPAGRGAPREPELAQAPPPREEPAPVPTLPRVAPEPRPAPDAPASKPPPRVARAEPAPAAPAPPLPEAADDELALALDLDTLELLDVIERLDFLQFLARQGRG